MDVKTNHPLTMVVLLFMCLFLKTRVSLGANYTISGNQSISGDQTIESAGGVFVLGFFKPGNSSNNYIGMWYKGIKPQTVVWVANRENPISNRYSSELKISDGNLVLFNESKLPIWSTNLNSTTTSSAQAVLNDNGNLVLNDGSDPPRVSWQSFDHPTHTWLPGSKISYNNVTKTHQRLTSWKNTEDPSPGLYTLELDESDDSYIILWNRTRRYWTSGPWNGQIFSKVPEMRRTYIYDFSFNVTNTERFFTYSVYSNKAIAISKFMMDVSGQIKQDNWLPANNMWSLFWSQPRTQCEVYAYCGAYGRCSGKSMPFCSCLTGFEPKSPSNWNLSDFSDGCVRRTGLQCRNSTIPNGERDKFLELLSVSLPENEQRIGAESLSDCKTRCLNDCSCVAYAHEDNACSVWTGELLNMDQLPAGDGNGKTLFLRLAASEIPRAKDAKIVLIGAVAGSVGGAVLVLGLVLFLVRRSRRRVGKGKAVEGSLVAFGYRDLQNATKNFSEKLGGGGFGSVFKGRLSDSTLVAVKQLQSVSQGEKQFRSEVSTIGTIQHMNLVRLRGFCSEGAHKLLVYDYMPNGSLDKHLFGRDGDGVAILEWRTRYGIALGTARGLVYLHEKCRDCIIHCDIKPENILLDPELCPKVADFGLAKLLGRDFSRVLTTMRGTRGYLAPEWIAGVAITPKADVYSYGMMLFEFVHGRRNSGQSEDGGVKFFPTLAASVVVGGGDVMTLLDPRLERTGSAEEEEEVRRVCRVACWCIQDDEANRPSMSQVVQILEGVVDVNVPPIPRSLHVFGDNQEKIIFFTESSSSQSSLTQSNVSTASSLSQASKT